MKIKKLKKSKLLYSHDSYLVSTFDGEYIKHIGTMKLKKIPKKYDNCKCKLTADLYGIEILIILGDNNAIL